MLKGIPDNISSDLLKALADMGHGDFLAVVDHFYPAYSKTPNGIVIEAKGNTAPEIIESILKLIPLDDQYCEHPVEHIIPDADSGVVLERSDTWDEVRDLVVKNGYDPKLIGTIERSKFYEKASHAFVTISTSERREYGCFLLQKGVQ